MPERHMIATTGRVSWSGTLPPPMPRPTTAHGWVRDRDTLLRVLAALQRL